MNENLSKQRKEKTIQQLRARLRYNENKTRRTTVEIKRTNISIFKRNKQLTVDHLVRKVLDIA